MKHLLVLSAFMAATLTAPAYAAVTPTCIYGGSGITQATNGAIVIISAIDNTCIFTPLVVGSSGQVLTSNGVSTLPSFAALPGGGPTLAGNNVWTGTNSFTNTVGLSVGTSGVNSTFLTWGTHDHAGETTWALSSNNTSTLAQCAAGGMNITNNATSTIILTLNRIGLLCTGGAIDSTKVLSQTTVVSQMLDPTSGGLITIPVVNLDGTQTANTVHCVESPSAGLTVGGTPASVVFTAATLAPFLGAYTLTVNDNGPAGFTNPAITAKAGTGFSFTATNFATDTYSFTACGE